MPYRSRLRAWLRTDDGRLALLTLVLAIVALLILLYRSLSHQPRPFKGASGPQSSIETRTDVANSPKG